MSQVQRPNETFWFIFHQHLLQRPNTFQGHIDKINILVKNAVQDYHANGDSHRSLQLVLSIESVIYETSKQTQSPQFDKKHLDLLKTTAQKFYEHPTIQEIRDMHTEEKSHRGTPKKVIPTSLHMEKISSFVAQNFPTKTAKRMNSESIAQKNGEEVLPLDQEDLKITKNKTDATQAALQEPDQEQNSFTKSNEVKGNKVVSDSEVFSPLFKPQTEQQNAELKKELDDLFAKMWNELKENRIDDAHKYLVQLREIEKTKCLNEVDKTLYINKIKENQKLINDVEENWAEAQIILKEIQEEDGYILESVKKNFQIKYKINPGEGVSLKMEGVVDVPIFNMIALIYEMQGYPQWMPFCADAKELKEVTMTSKVGWMKYSMPPPIFGREAYIYGVGFDRMNVNGSILLCAKSIHDNEKLAKKYGVEIPTNSKTTRLDLNYMGGAIYPLSRDKIKLSLVTKFDPKIKFIPMSLVNWVVRKAATFLLDRLVKKATNMTGTIWEQRIKENRKFYGWLEEKLEDYLKKQLLTDKDLNQPSQSQKIVPKM